VKRDTAKAAPPTKFTITDKYKLLLGLIALISACDFMANRCYRHITAALMIGIAFIALRLSSLAGYTRIKQ